MMEFYQGRFYLLFLLFADEVVCVKKYLLVSLCVNQIKPFILYLHSYLKPLKYFIDLPGKV